MQPKSVAGLFCEDIRSERSGAFTLIGIMPDNANVPAPPMPDQRGIIPKLCLYIRMNFDAADTVKNISTKVRLPDGNELDMGPVAPNIVEQAFESSRTNGSPLAIIAVRVEFPGFPITELGRIIAEVTIDEEVFIVAQLNLSSDPNHKQAPMVEDVRHYSQRLELKPTSTTS
jgi:hypothetical protein